MWGYTANPKPNTSVTMDPWTVAAQKSSGQPLNYLAMTSSHSSNESSNDYWGIAAAAVQNQTTNAISTLINDLSSGSGNRPPKLMEMSEYNQWQKKFKIHLEGMGLEGT